MAGDSSTQPMERKEEGVYVCYAGLSRAHKYMQYMAHIVSHVVYRKSIEQ